MQTANSQGKLVQWKPTTQASQCRKILLLLDLSSCETGLNHDLLLRFSLHRTLYNHRNFQKILRAQTDIWLRHKTTSNKNTEKCQTDCFPDTDPAGPTLATASPGKLQSLHGDRQTRMAVNIFAVYRDEWPSSSVFQVQICAQYRWVIVNNKKNSKNSKPNFEANRKTHERYIECKCMGLRIVQRCIRIYLDLSWPMHLYFHLDVCPTNQQTALLRAKTLNLQLHWEQGECKWNSPTPPQMSFTNTPQKAVPHKKPQIQFCTFVAMLMQWFHSQLIFLCGFSRKKAGINFPTFLFLPHYSCCGHRYTIHCSPPYILLFSVFHIYNSWHIEKLCSHCLDRYFYH